MLHIGSGLGLHTTQFQCYTRFSSLHVHRDCWCFQRFHKLPHLWPTGLLLTEPSITPRTWTAAFESDNLSAATCTYISPSFKHNIAAMFKVLPKYPLFTPRAFATPQHQLFTGSSLSYLLFSFQGSIWEERTGLEPAISITSWWCLFHRKELHLSAKLPLFLYIYYSRRYIRSQLPTFYLFSLVILRFWPSLGLVPDSSTLQPKHVYPCLWPGGLTIIYYRI